MASPFLSKKSCCGSISFHLIFQTVNMAPWLKSKKKISYEVEFNLIHFCVEKYFLIQTSRFISKVNRILRKFVHIVVCERFQCCYVLSSQTFLMFVLQGVLSHLHLKKKKESLLLVGQLGVLMTVVQPQIDLE